jgi:hypothetical protein
VATLVARQHLSSDRSQDRTGWYYQVVDDHSRRLQYLPVAAFYDGDNGHSVAIRRSDDTLAECIEELESESGVPWADWLALADDFLTRYE